MGGLPVQPRTQPIPLAYRLIRAFLRFLTGVWFREIHLVDDEYLESEGGVLFVSWHPNGLLALNWSCLETMIGLTLLPVATTS